MQFTLRTKLCIESNVRSWRYFIDMDVSILRLCLPDKKVAAKYIAAKLANFKVLSLSELRLDLLDFHAIEHVPAASLFTGNTHSRMIRQPVHNDGRSQKLQKINGAKINFHDHRFSNRKLDMQGVSKINCNNLKTL